MKLSMQMLVSLMLSVLFVSSANAIEDAEILDQVRFDVQQLPGESIDVFTGKVSWRNVDATIPGPAGMDIVLARSFNKQVAGRWVFEMPRIDVATKMTCGEDTDIKCRGKWKRELLGGGTLTLPGQDPIILTKYGSSSYMYGSLVSVTGERWSVTVKGLGYNLDKDEDLIFTAYAPNGRKIVFTGYHKLEENYLIGKLDTHYHSNIVISDPSGNTITYYSNASGIYKIEASDGRKVEFELQNFIEGYVNYAYPSKMKVYDTSSSVRIWDYEYEPVYHNYFFCSQAGDKDSRQECEGTATEDFYYTLTKMTDPENQVWNYEFKSQDMDPPLLKRVVFPTGGEVAYNYDNGDIKKTVKEASQPDAIWTYQTKEGSFDRSWTSFNNLFTRGAEYTTVVGPYSRTRYYFNNLFYNDSSHTDNGLYGKLKKMVVTSVADSSFSSPLRTVEYEYYKGGKRGYVSRTGQTAGVERYAFRNFLKKTVIDGRFTTEYSDLDSTDLWQTKTETTGSAARITRYEYKHTKGSATARQFIGLPLKTTIEGVNGETWVTTNTYNSRGQLITSTVNGINEVFSYHSSGTHDAGNLYQHKYYNVLGTSTETYTNYYRGTARRVDYPLGIFTKSTVNPSGTVATQTDGEGNTTSYSYDSLNRVIRVKAPGKTATHISYAPNKVTITRDNSGYRKEITLDGLGRPVLTKELANGISPVYIRTEYDTVGRETFVSYASNSSSESQGVRTTYDALNRPLTSVTTADNGVTKYCYGISCASYLSGYSFDDAYVVTNARGYKSAFLKQGFGSPENAWNRYIIRDITSAARQQTTVTRNKIGDITKVVQDGVARSYAYFPGTRRLQAITEPERGKVLLTYDASGNVITRKVGSKGYTTYEYDKLNRLVTLDYPGTTPDITYAYNNNGQVTSQTKGGVVRTYDYTAWGALNWEQLQVNNETFKLDYSYNTHGQLYRVKYPNNETLTYILDDFGRPTSVGQFASNIQYYPTGQVKSLRYGNGQQVNYTLNARKFVERIKSSSAQLTAMDLNYTFDKNANVKSITDNLNNLNSISVLNYDRLDRLTSATGRWGNGNFSYDAKGNFVAKNLGSFGTLTYHYDDNTNRLTSISGAEAYNFQYDTYGNVVNNGRLTMTYTDAGELIKVAGEDLTRDYTYDAEGLRVWEINNDKSIYQMHTQGGDLLYEEDSITNKKSMYIRFDGKNLAKMDSCLSTDDLDGDGMNDCVEEQLGYDIFTPTDAYADDDGDGLSNLREIQLGTNPRDADTDNDGIPDGWEERYDLNPLVNDSGADIDGDGASNLQEYQNDTDPHDPLNVPLAAKLVPIFYLLLN